LGIAITAAQLLLQGEAEALTRRAATAGFSADVAAIATEDAATFARLKAPVKRVYAIQVPIPYSPVLESHVFPDRNRIIAGIREVLEGRRSAEAA
jgi:pyruvate/2-oxoglutarate/acetoin dehydrogenase E1 component